MYDSDYWYVFFVKTNKEELAVKDINDAFSNDEIKAFVPYVERFFKKEKEKQIMFQGYLFVETTISSEEFRLRSWECIKKSKNIIKLLTYGDSEEAAIKSEERKAIQKFWKNDNNGIDASKGIIEGDKVIITEGSLVGMEIIIKKIDRHKMKAYVEIEFLGKLHIVDIGLEIIKKVL